jgi:Cu/Ag efflux pump CusA
MPLNWAEPDRGRAMIARLKINRVGLTLLVSMAAQDFYMSGVSFSVSAAVGFISLFGVSVMNGMLRAPGDAALPQPAE